MEMTAECNFYKSLYDLAVQINKANTPNSVLRHLVRLVTRAMKVRAGSLMLLTPDGKHLIHAAEYGLSGWYFREGQVFIDKSIEDALRGIPVAVFDAKRDERIKYQEQARSEGIVSILTMPIILREEVIGVIRVYTSTPYRFTDDDIYFVGAAANLGAIALENTRLYKNSEHEYNAFKREILEWRAALGTEWLSGDIVISANEPENVRTAPSFLAKTGDVFERVMKRRTTYST